MPRRLLLALPLLAGCADPPDAQVASYCYRTLADVTCYVRPVPQDHDRLTGWVGPPPLPQPARPALALVPPPRDGGEGISR